MMDKIAQKLALWFGSAPFILFHVVWFTTWIVLHMTQKFDPTWSSLTVVVSIEAIFLSLFILRAENVASSKQEQQMRLDVKKTSDIFKEIKKQEVEITNHRKIYQNKKKKK